MQIKTYWEYTLNFKSVAIQLLAYLFVGLLTFSIAEAGKLAIASKFGSAEGLVLFVLDVFLVVLSATITSLLTRGKIDDYLNELEEHTYLRADDKHKIFKSLLYKSILLYSLLATPTLWVISEIIYLLI